METYKVVEILNKLGAVELRRLIRFLALDARAQNPQLERVLNILMRNKSLLPKKELIKLTGLQEKRLGDIMNKILAIVEEFCSLESVRNYDNEFDQNRHLLIFLHQHDLANQYSFHYEKTVKKIKSIASFAPLEHLSIYHYLKIVSIHEKIVRGRKLNIKLTDYAPHLDVFYCLEKLKLISENISRANIRQRRELDEDFAIVLPIAGKYEKDYPLVDVYLRIIETLKGDKDPCESFIVLYQKIEQIPINKYSRQEVLTLCHYLINILIRGMRNGLTDSRKCYLQLIAFLESKELLLEDGLVSPPIFKNTITVALNSDKSEVAEIFYEKYHKYLPRYNRREVSLFCSALIDFHAQRYSEAAKKIRGIKLLNLDAYFVLGIRKLEAKIFMEESIKQTDGLRGNLDLRYFEHMMRNLRIYIRDNKGIGIENKKAALKFVSFAFKAVASYQVRDALRSLRQKLEKESFVDEKEWLLSFMKKK